MCSWKTVLLASQVYFKAMQLALTLREVDGREGVGLPVFITEMINLHRGQGRELYWRDHQIVPTEEEYDAMVIDKTGGLFRLAIKLMQCYSQNATDFTHLANLLALFFQIRDDFQNLVATQYAHEKGFAEDLTEGKFSFLIVHAVRSNLEDTRLLSILKQRTHDIALKKHAIEYMRSCGSFAYTSARLRALMTEIITQVDHLGGNVRLSNALAALSAGLELDSEVHVPQP